MNTHRKKNTKKSPEFSYHIAAKLNNAHIVGSRPTNDSHLQAALTIVPNDRSFSPVHQNKHLPGI